MVMISWLDQPTTSTYFYLNLYNDQPLLLSLKHSGLERRIRDKIDNLANISKHSGKEHRIGGKKQWLSLKHSGTKFRIGAKMTNYFLSLKHSGIEPRIRDKIENSLYL